MERLVQHQPTQYPTSEELSIGMIKFKAFDLGGHQIARRVWKDYYAKLSLDSVPTIPRNHVNRDTLRPVNETERYSYGLLNVTIDSKKMSFLINISGHLVDAVVYIVDAFDKVRFAESKKELDALLSDDALANVPFLVLGNKIDIPAAASEEELRYSLGLTNFTTGKGKVNLTDSNVRPLEVFMCSIVRKMGYGDGFKWLSQYIK
ncbi:GTP-binding protein SAR1a [Asimina triloba]